MRLLCSLCAFGVGLTAALSACAKPNVIVIISDDAGWADFGFNRAATSQANPGNRGAIPTPNLDQLASQGVAFTNAYGASVCAISRAMLTTGVYGNRFGFNNNIQDDATAINAVSIVQGLPLAANTIWERMQSVGYNTAAVGKWHLGQHANGGGQLGNRPENQGVEFFEGLLGGSRNYTVGGETGVAQTLRRTISNGAGTVASTVAIESQFNGQYVTDVLGDRSAQYIRDQASAGGDPFFLYSSFTAPHTPLQATAADLAYIDSLGIAGFTGTRRTQAAMQYALDRNVGKILSSLGDPNGDGNTADSIAENTLIMFVNDNGGDCCDVDPNASSNGVLRNGKGSQFEGGYRVPFVVAGAGVAQGKRGTVSSEIVSVIDMLPTAFLGAGEGALSGSEAFDGVNLLPYINDTASGVAHEELFYPRFSADQSAIRRGDWKLMYQTNTGYQLYNLATDPDESDDVVDVPANAALLTDLRLRLAGYHVQMDKPRYDNQAPATNQFDHFRFREDAFSTASFSTAGAWVNAESAGGTFTASSLDGYADNRITLRAKSNGDYTLTNDLGSVGGFAYITNELNLASSPAALVGNRTATINGAGLMLTASRAGVLPRINLTATDVRPQAFTFRVEQDLELYDDLTIAGNGNQNFEFAGDVREFRPGRKLVKEGSSDVTFAGKIDVSEAVDLQGGKVSFHQGSVRGDLIARSGVAVMVGQRGIVTSGGGGPPVAIVQPGLELNYDAALDISGDAAWTDAVSPADNLAFGGSASSVNVATSTFPYLTKAYSIPTSGGASGLNNYFESSGPRSQQDATFEVVFNASNLAAGTNQVLFEVGGATRGVAFVVNNQTLTFNVDGNASDINLNTPLTAGWHHAVGVIDVNSAGAESVYLYVDNQLAGTLSGQTIGDWSGGNTAGLGAGASSVTGVTPEPGSPFHGEIAVARYYANTVFTPAEVAQNHQWLLQSAPNSLLQPPVTLAITGDFTLEPQTTLELDVASPTTHDKVQSSGAAHLNGSLVVSAAANTAFAAGEMFEVISATTLQGKFAEADLPALPDGLMWQLRYNATALQLVVTIAGDYNGDGAVSAADFTVWRDALGQGVSLLTGADGNGDGQVTLLDYEVWRNNFGNQVASLASALAVPEPTFAAFSLLGGLLMSSARNCQL